MVNAPDMHKAKRKTRIDSIKVAIEKLTSENKAIHKDKLVLETMYQYSVSKKTAEEYVEVAMYAAGVSSENNTPF